MEPRGLEPPAAAVTTRTCRRESKRVRDATIPPADAAGLVETLRRRPRGRGEGSLIDESYAIALESAQHVRRFWHNGSSLAAIRGTPRSRLLPGFGIDDIRRLAVWLRCRRRLGRRVRRSRRRRIVDPRTGNRTAAASFARTANRTPDLTEILHGWLSISNPINPGWLFTESLLSSMKIAINWPFMICIITPPRAITS